ncbi:MAG: FAD-dependent oxidoreductase [Spirochaetales bacterium]|nr:FAD-dependent oxidoreductase [Spirochaetales bacterium]
MEQKYDFIIVGGGLAGASAIEGIRSLDRDRTVLLAGADPNPPYDRPPLSKQLWTGKKKPEQIFLHDDAWYRDAGVDLRLGTTVRELDVTAKSIILEGGERVGYGKLLLATGGQPRRLTAPGAELPRVRYFRTYNDYLWLRERATPGARAVVVGGGFIGSEIAAALSMNGVAVTMIFPEPYLAQRVFPEGLGRAVQEEYGRRGVTVLAGDIPVSFEERGETIVVRTREDCTVEAEFVVAGIGIIPAISLALGAGLASNGVVHGGGIRVNEFLATSNPEVYAAGDNASFSAKALGETIRIEHWDNALAQGKAAGRNMAGAGEPFEYLPYFFSDLFDFGYEAAGLVDARLPTRAVWRKENETGVVYYLRDGLVKGVMLCNVWGKVDEARRVISTGVSVSDEDLKKAIAV